MRKRESLAIGFGMCTDGMEDECQASSGRGFVVTLRVED